MPIDVIKPKKICKIVVGFAPAKPRPVTRSFVIHDNSKTGSTQTITLKGTGK